MVKKVFILKTQVLHFFKIDLKKITLLNYIKHFNIKINIERIDIQQKKLPTCSFFKNDFMKNFDTKEVEGNRKIFILSISAMHKARRAVSIISTQ